MNKKYKGMLLLTLLVFMMTLYILPVSADVLNDRAKALNTLSILNGDGGSFNLTGQLKRSEAAAFMVRMLGQEANVLTNKEIYSNSKFTDVKSDQWYAPYIGFCTENEIITGYSDGKFKPNDYLSEKSALTLILKSLGYKWNTDFNWDTVFQKAYTVGIIKDSSYLKKTADNTKYTRGNLVNALYESLTLKKNGSESTMLEDLISSGVITKDTAKSAGLIKDTMKTAVVSAQAIDLSRVSVKFNENIGSLAAINIYTYDSSNTQIKLNAYIESQNGSEVIFKTSGQTEGINYKIEMSNIIDTEGFATESITTQFKGYKIPEVVSDYFKISKIESIDKKTINIYFTHPINVNAESPNFYEIVQESGQFVAGSPQTLLVRTSTSTQNSVMLYLKDKEFTDNEVYTINIKGDLTSAYSVKLNDGKGDKATFTAKGKDLETLKIVGATALTSNSLLIDFNKDIDTNFAEKKVNYTIKQKATGLELPVNSATVVTGGDKKGKAVVISLSSAFDRTKEYELTIEYLSDRFKESFLDGVKYAFYGYYPDRSDIGLVAATSLDSGTIVIYTDRVLDLQSAQMTGNYVITSVVQPSIYFYPLKVYYDPVKDPYIVKLYLPTDKSLNTTGGTYMVKIQSLLKDYLGNMSSKPIECGFNSNGSTSAKPIISEAVMISQDTLKVVFNKDIALDVPNILNTNYHLEYKQDGSTFKKIPTGVNYYNGTTLILKFDTLDPSIKYTLSFDSLKDYVGNIRTSADGQSTIEVRVGK